MTTEWQTQKTCVLEWWEVAGMIQQKHRQEAVLQDFRQITWKNDTQHPHFGGNSWHMDNIRWVWQAVTCNPGWEDFFVHFKSTVVSQNKIISSSVPILSIFKLSMWDLPAIHRYLLWSLHHWTASNNNVTREQPRRYRGVQISGVLLCRGEYGRWVPSTSKF